MTGLMAHCENDKQRRTVEAYERLGVVEAAKELGVHHSVVGKMIQRIKRRAAEQDVVPTLMENNTLQEPYIITNGTMSVKDGKIVQVWPRYKVRPEFHCLRSFAEGLVDGITPAEPRPALEAASNDILPALLVGDAHIGMRAYAKETRHSDFDTKIGVRQLLEATRYLVGKSERADHALLVDVGDFMHADSGHDTTHKGTKVDVDTRHHMVMRAAAEAMISMVDIMLEKFNKVSVVISRGNHNEDMAGAIQLMLYFYFHKEPRVNVVQTEGFYHYVTFGKWLIGVCHGDKQKPTSLASSMARDMAKAWGDATHRIWLTGHYHKEKTVTLPGVKVKVCAALPPPDSWHAGQGYSGDSELELMTFRRSGGVHSQYLYNIPQPQFEPDITIA